MYYYTVSGLVYTITDNVSTLYIYMYMYMYMYVY